VMVTSVPPPLDPWFGLMGMRDTSWLAMRYIASRDGVFESANVPSDASRFSSPLAKWYAVTLLQFPHGGVGRLRDPQGHRIEERG
jgi:hypothetical protein